MTAELQTTTVAAPNLDALPVIDFTRLIAFRVVDENTMQSARSLGQDAKAFIEAADKEFDAPTKLAHKLHRALTGWRAKVIAPAEEAVNHLRTQIVNYDMAKEAKRRALEEQLQREAQVRAEAEAKLKRDAELAEAKRKRDEEIANLMPWEIGQAEVEPIAVPPEVPVFAERVTVAQTPTAGIRNLPWKYAIDNFAALVKAAAEDPALLDALQVNDNFMKMKVKEMGENIGTRYPGIRAVREKTAAL